MFGVSFSEPLVPQIMPLMSWAGSIMSVIRTSSRFQRICNDQQQLERHGSQANGRAFADSHEGLYN